jgi:hypothetical protein
LTKLPFLYRETNHGKRANHADTKELVALAGETGRKRFALEPYAEMERKRRQASGLPPFFML